MKKQYYYLLWLGAILICLAVLSYCLLYVYAPAPVIDDYVSIPRIAHIRPDYVDVVMPANIAPLNFLVQEKGAYYYVKIYSEQAEPIEVFSRSAKIIIPLASWRKLLNTNRGRWLYFDIYVKTEDGRWNRFDTIKNKIADETIDDYLVYRTIDPLYSHVRETEIRQRNLGNYDDRPVLLSKNANGACLNCHMFCNYRPDKMLLGARSPTYGTGTILVQNGKVDTIDTKFGYTCWHPSGKLAVFSLNKVQQFFHSARNEVRDVVDLYSSIAYFLLDSRTVKTSPKFSSRDQLENWPTWSADGRYLYFCRAPVLWTDRKTVPPENYEKVKYTLLRISYDIEKDEWGEVETVLSALDTGLSVLEPRISPDGRWLLFCMCQYSCWPAYQDSSDLYMIDLEAARRTGKYQYMVLDEANSDQSESWHSWSSNSRWIAFSSKRETVFFTRIYLSYVDTDGRAYKPILIPQKDPAYYDSCLWTLGVGEFLCEPLRVRQEKLGRAAITSRKIAVDMPITMATPKAGGAPGKQGPWERE